MEEKKKFLKGGGGQRPRVSEKKGKKNVDRGGGDGFGREFIFGEDLVFGWLKKKKRWGRLVAFFLEGAEEV